MTTDLRQTIEAELDRREAHADAQHKAGRWSDGRHLDALRRYAAARRVLARHRPVLWESLTGERRCARCGDTLDCPEIADMADSLGLSTTTSEEQRNG